MKTRVGLALAIMMALGHVLEGRPCPFGRRKRESISFARTFRLRKPLGPLAAIAIRHLRSNSPRCQQRNSLQRKSLNALLALILTIHPCIVGTSDLARGSP